jgi:hypothetical protein
MCITEDKQGNWFNDRNPEDVRRFKLLRGLEFQNRKSHSDAAKKNKASGTSRRSIPEKSRSRKKTSMASHANAHQSAVLMMLQSFHARHNGKGSTP